MRTTIVPAQITTVEDRIAGNLTVTQLMLLLAPIFFGGFVYIVLPPQNDFTPYKIISIVLVSCIAGSLAVRVKGRVVLQWLAVLLRYANRPRYYVCDKNDMSERILIPEQKAPVKKATARIALQKQVTKSFSLAQTNRLERLVQNPKAKVRFIFARKGGMRVSFTKIF